MGDGSARSSCSKTALLASALFYLQCTPPAQTSDLGAADLGPALPPIGAPLQAPANTWTWIDIPESSCDDGSPTGIGVNLNGSKDLLVFLNGGGACWDYATCVLFNTSTHGPFGSPQFAALVGGGVSGSVLDRAAPNPFANYNLVFVPYCTGDIHAGDNVITYTSGTDQKVFHHKGRANVLSYLTRIAATVPAGGKVVVSGSSAGGFGTNMVYDLFHHYFSSSKLSLLDDSGPLLVGDAIQPVLRDSWYASWGLDRTLAPRCPTCKQDMSTLIPTLAAKYPDDRMGLLSYTQDDVIRTYFGLLPTDFQTDLYALAGKQLDPQPKLHYYFVTGSSHTFLGKPGPITAQGIPLWTWLTQFATDDPAWTSTKP
jgi:hypothetical protein